MSLLAGQFGFLATERQKQRIIKMHRPRTFFFGQSSVAVDSSESDEADEEEQIDSEFATPNRKRRRTGRNAKESAALGVFYNSDDDAAGRKRKTLRNKGVAFVKPGNKDAGHDMPEREGQESDEDVGFVPFGHKGLGFGDDGSEGEGQQLDEGARFFAPSDEGPGSGDDDPEGAEKEFDDVGGAGLGLGTSEAETTPSTQRPLPTQQSTSTSTSTPSNRKPSMKHKLYSVMPFGNGFTPSSASAPVLKVKDEDKNKAKTKGTKFSAKDIMARMGWNEGEGLGRDRQGRAEAIKPVLLPTGKGLGFGKVHPEEEGGGKAEG
jgi:tuftelin-interacting protein 11